SPPAAPRFVNAFTPPPPPQDYRMTPPPPPSVATMAQGMPNYPTAPQTMPPPTGMQAAPTTPVNYPQNYQGPQTPISTAQTLPPVQPIRYAPPPSMQSVAAANPMDRRQAVASPTAAPVSSAELAQITQVLRESPYPAQREWASYTLAT